MWGIPVAVSFHFDSIGITPTHVGNTQMFSAIFNRDKNHPHTCGEYGGRKQGQLQAEESPPHMWGIRVFLARFSQKNRITPTHVGNTHQLKDMRAIPGNHPHTCGEYPYTTGFPLLTAESPPHMWGIHSGYAAKYGTSRITPTHVGNTLGENPA